MSSPQAPVASPPVTSDADSPVPQKQKSRWTAQLFDDVDPTFAYVQLLLCCVASGLCDSVAFNASGVFVSMQTGNTIFLALGASSLPAGQSRLWLKAIVSIACFQAGCYLFSKFRHLRAQRKITLFASCLTQTIFLILAAALSQGHVITAFGLSRLSTSAASEASRTVDENKSIILLPIALLAFQFGGQIYTSRVLGFSEVPTNVLTSLYCDLLSDPKLLASPLGANPKRNRRVAAAVLTLVGGIVGGWLQRSRGGMCSALWVAAALKLGISFSWLFWPSGGSAKEQQGGKSKV